MNGATFMKQKNGKNNYESNIIPFIKCAQKNDEKVTSTLAAILAIKIEHPKNISPEEFFIELIESFGNIDVLAFEDALENEHIGLTSSEAQNEAANDA
tara:strand:+ start:855 stop:1148 length:294 start_codon:yes stop_codon:yes gene_type:complete